MIEIQQRIQRAAESILENEALTTDLDDEAAKLLLDWGVNLAQQIASETIEMDEAPAEEAMYHPMRALRKMLRVSNKWVLDPQERGLGRILKQAAMLYGAEYISPTNAQQTAFLIEIPAAAIDRVNALRSFVAGERGGSIGA